MFLLTYFCTFISFLLSLGVCIIRPNDFVFIYFKALDRVPHEVDMHGGLYGAWEWTNGWWR